MRPESDPHGERPSAKRPEHRHERHPWPLPARGQSPAPGWNSKTMHHPAFRVGEIKHGKS